MGKHSRPLTLEERRRQVADYWAKAPRTGAATAPIEVTRHTEQAGLVLAITASLVF